MFGLKKYLVNENRQSITENWNGIHPLSWFFCRDKLQNFFTLSFWLITPFYNHPPTLKSTGNIYWWKQASLSSSGCSNFIEFHDNSDTGDRRSVLLQGKRNGLPGDWSRGYSVSKGASGDIIPPASTWHCGWQCTPGVCSIFRAKGPARLVDVQWARNQHEQRPGFLNSRGPSAWRH